MYKARRTIVAALVVSATSAALLGGTTTSAAASGAGDQTGGIPGDTTCERFLYVWGPNYTFPGLNCP